MDIIAMAREIGKEIQKDDRYLKMRLAVQATDDDQNLQDLIGQYNLKRMALDAEAQKRDRDAEKVQTYGRELDGLYETIMKIPSMIAYNGAKAELDGLIQRVHAIVDQSAGGADPETADFEPGCGGDCGSCAGCR